MKKGESLSLMLCSSHLATSSCFFSPQDITSFSAKKEMESEGRIFLRGLVIHCSSQLMMVFGKTGRLVPVGSGHCLRDQSSHFVVFFSSERKRTEGRRKGKLRLTVKFVEMLKEYCFAVQPGKFSPFKQNGSSIPCVYLE